MRHHRLVTALVSSAALAGVSVVPASAHEPVPSGAPITVEMTGAQEAPGPGDPDGHGTAMLRLNPGLEQVCWTLEVTGIAPATAAHIHLAPAGSPGPVVVTLSAPTSGMSSGCADVHRDLVRDIIDNPSAYYVNVHNADHPAGAVRGQLG
ncbi:CHRD domain-containing protein [Ornithinimicrobium tianjinense]|uniref:CHRD domain-containing protein n=1 Tax=Ornithinimicrobium tianjinense TaxID=1195761 RepID=A0A917F3L4_9MICO|nr:CHRD domain-containing protein [Ornithinimicrobium tianjinense]GGF46948.1 CHRD domain-containing protein [Ornithinimicrobium tianjinense]